MTILQTPVTLFYLTKNINDNKFIPLNALSKSMVSLALIGMSADNNVKLNSQLAALPSVGQMSLSIGGQDESTQC
ncbi:MAG: hypothetical protein WC687_03690 [Patescibacteria group bacterium]|jgi:hypothetical protein